MARASIAQVGNGAANVVAHPGFRTLPPCQFKLHSGKAQKRYDELARLIWNAGRLSIDTHMTLSTYAKLVDHIATAETEGKTLRASWFKQLQDAQRRLSLDDLDKPISAPAEAPVNPYASFGFASGG